jgi:hypothetical protein
MDLYNLFLENKNNVAHKWLHYFPIYERHFSEYKNKPITFLEIGVWHGGSLEIWERYFGPRATIIGVDIDPRSKPLAKNNIKIEIGDQTDPKFLASIIEKYGTPDIVLDDGCHTPDGTFKTFEFLYPKLRNTALYAIEDLHTSYWQEYGNDANSPHSFINRCKTYVDQLNVKHTRGQIVPNPIVANTFGISFYDSVAIFEKGAVSHTTDVKTGTKYLGSDH